MSSLLAKITAVSKAPPDEIPTILGSISESMKRAQLSEKEMRELCSVIIQKLPNSPPAVFRAIISISDEIISSSSYPDSFPKSLLVALKTPLGSQKKQMRDPSISLAEKLIPILTPEKFWDIMFDSFASKSMVVKESALILLNHTLSNNPTFKLARMLRPVFSLLMDSSPELRQESLSVVSIIHQRSPDKVEAALRKQFAGKADEIISKLTGNSEPKKQIETYASVSSQPEPPALEEQLVSEFENPCHDIKPIESACPFSQLEKTLGRSSDWEERMNALKVLVAHCKGSSKPDAFVRGFRAVQDPFVECLTDARSTLSKFACLSLAAMAGKLKNAIDQCSDWLIPPVLQRTNHATAVIALSSGYAVMKYVESVCGKRIKQILVDFAENPSLEVRLFVIRSMIIAQDHWPPGMSEEFADIIYLKQKDPSEKVRALAGSVQHKPQITVESVILDDPITDSLVEDPMQTIEECLEEKKLPELVEVIRTSSPQPDLTGFMQRVISLLVDNLNEGNVASATDLLKLLCEHYTNNLYSYLSQVIWDLPRDERFGEECLSYLAKSFGDLPMARLLQKSNLEYVNEFLLKVAEMHPSDVDFCARVVLNAITNGFYSKFRNRILEMITAIFNSDEMKCEHLFTAIPTRERNEMILDIKDTIPQIYSLFLRETDQNISEILVRQIENAKNGEAIDFSIIRSLPETDSVNLLLGIAGIRESQHFQNEFVPFLIKCTANKDPAVVGAATLAMQETCVTNPRCCALIADSFVCTSACLKCFARSLRFAEKESARAALWKLQDPITQAITDYSTKYAALDIISNAVVYVSDEFRTFVGGLHNRNVYLLDRMIETERSQAK